MKKIDANDTQQNEVAYYFDDYWWPAKELRNDMLERITWVHIN